MKPDLDGLMILLSRGLGQRKLYFAGHSRIRNLCLEFVANLKELLDAQERDSLFIGVVDGKLVFKGRFLIGPSIAGRPLVVLAENLQSGGLIFDRRTTEEEVQELLSLGVELRNPVADLENGRALLASYGITGITLAGEYSGPSNLLAKEERVVWQGKSMSGHYLQSPILIYQALFEAVTMAHGNAALGRAIDIDGVRSVSEHLLHSTRASFMDMMQLVHYPDYDSYTIGHSVRVATLAVFAGQKLNLNDDQLRELGTAGLLHDVGKSKIPDEITFKPARLNEEEFAIMRLHSRLGAEILLEHKNATPMDVAAAWGHHIRHDGGGYPEKLPWAVRDKVTVLLQVCDVFEALTAIRPYKRPVSPWKAYDIMLKDKGAFDPVILATFVRMMGLYPPGNRVRLADGRQGTVAAAGREIDRPRIRITHAAAGTFLAAADQYEIDLGVAGESETVVEDLMLEAAEFLDSAG